MGNLFKKYFLYFAAINFLNLLLFYTSAYVFMNDAWEYVRYFISETVDFILPVVAAAAVAADFKRHGFWSLLLALAASLARFVFIYPYFYLYFIDRNLLTEESLIVSLPFSLGIVLIDFVAVSFLFFVIYIVTDLLSRRCNRLFSECVDTATSPFDFSEEFTVGTFFAGVLIFIINLVREVIDTVSYLIAYAGEYRLGEILYIVVSFIMILAELILCQLVIFKIKNARDSKNQT